MRIAKRPAELGFDQYDITRLTKALQCATDARLFQRVQAVLWVAQGDTISEVAELTGVSMQTVYNGLQHSLARQQVAALADAPRSGRPVTAPRMTAAPIRQHLQCHPLRFGDRTTVWSVTLLAAPLRRQYAGPINPPTLRRRRKAMGLRCQRPRYFYEEKAPHRAQKKGQESAVSGSCQPTPSSSVRRRRCCASFPSCAVPGLGGAHRPLSR